MKKYCMLLVVVLMLMVSSAAFAEIILGDQISGLYKQFYITDAAQSTISNATGLVWDPTSKGLDGNYNRIYVMENSSTASKRGLYAVDVYNATYSARVALSGLSGSYMTACDSSGNVYAGNPGTPEVYKVTNPMGSSPVETKMLGDYGPTTADDDPASIGMVPTGFGKGTAGQDLILFDAGIDTNGKGGVTVVYSDSTVASPHYETVWSNTTAVTGLRGTVNNLDGYAYFALYTLQTASTEDGDRYYINRVKGDGVLQRIFLDIDPANMFSSFDYAITTNPLDGSIWLALRETTSGTATRKVYRIDTENLETLSVRDFLADISVQLTLQGTDAWQIGNQNLAFSPDGKFLAVGCPSGYGGQDQLFIYSVPEPATIALLGFGMLTLLRKRR